MSAVDSLAAKRTLIIVSHHMRTLRRADVVHHIEQGRIVASGPIARFGGMFGADTESAPIKGAL